MPIGLPPLIPEAYALGLEDQSVAGCPFEPYESTGK